MKFGKLVAIVATLLALLAYQCSSPEVCQQSSDCSVDATCEQGSCIPKALNEGSSKEVVQEATGEGTTGRDASGKESAGAETVQDSGPGQESGAVESNREGAVESGPESEVGEGVSGPLLRIWIAGDTQPVTFNDGLAGQTPKKFSMGIQKFVILRERNDPNPVVIFDFKDKSTQASMDRRTLVGQGAFSTIPKGIYPYGRTTVVNMKFEVDATAHAAGFAIPGLLKIYYAIGNHSDSQGKSYKIGDVVGSFDGAGQSYPYQNNVPVKFSLSDPETWVNTTSGKTEFYFKIGKAIQSDGVTQDVDVTLNFSIYEAFRWRDLDRDTYTQGVFDMTTSPSTSEQVLRYGANNYRITQP